MDTTTDIRFTVPLYTVPEAARFLDVRASTLGTWARGYRRRPPGRPVIDSSPILTTLSAPRAGEPTIPFIGLAEGMVVAAFRRARVSMQHIRAAIRHLEREMGIEHALASRRLYTDGAVVLYDYAEREGDEDLANLTVVATQQRVFSDAVADSLRRIDYGSGEWAERLTSPVTEAIVVDPARGFGQPIFVRGGVRVEDVVDRWRAGEPMAEVAADFGVPLTDVEDYLRVAVPAAA